MNKGEEILNLLDLNWYFFVKPRSNSKIFDIDCIEIALTLDDALAGSAHDMLEDFQFIPSADVKVCNNCGTAKLVILKHDQVLCSTCGHKQGVNDLLLRNNFIKKSNEEI